MRWWPRCGRGATGPQRDSKWQFQLPLAWETALWGFPSQFQLLVLFGLAHLALTWAADRCDWRWGLGTLAGMAALGTMGSGFASALASVALASWRLLRGRDASASVPNRSTGPPRGALRPPLSRRRDL